MKKSLVALAALAVSGAAMAQVTLSGRASIDMSTWQAVNSTAGSASDLASRTRVADSGSRITFAVNEDLGGGMKAGLMCETGINVDNAERTGQSAVSTPTPKTGVHVKAVLISATTWWKLVWAAKTCSGLLVHLTKLAPTWVAHPSPPTCTPVVWACTPSAVKT